MNDQQRQGVIQNGVAGVAGLKLSVPCIVIVKDHTTERMSKEESQAATDAIDKILGVGKYQNQTGE